jgi:hypothetical protein
MFADKKNVSRFSDLTVLPAHSKLTDCFFVQVSRFIFLRLQFEFTLSFSSLPKATPFQHIADEGMSLKPGFRAVTTLCNFNISPTKGREAPVDPD